MLGFKLNQLSASSMRLNDPCGLFQCIFSFQPIMPFLPLQILTEI